MLAMGACIAPNAEHRTVPLGKGGPRRQYAAPSRSERGFGTMARTVALVLAGGRGIRAGGGIPKQYRRIAGVPMMRLTLAAFARHPRIDAVRAVIHPDDRDQYAALCGDLGVAEPAFGGETRQESSYNGLKSIDFMDPDYVLIQDAARPFTDPETIDRVIEALGRAPGALAAVPVIDTIKRGDTAGRVAATVDRAGLWRAQTPQGFRYRPILAAFGAAAGSAYTDDAAVAEAAGLEVTLVMGHEDNIKVTTERDFARAEQILRERAGGGMADIRTGTGFDVHRFEPGDHVTLCGVRVPHSAGLKGHSDADVGLHALTDAIFGAIGAGDIGDHFPPTDPQWRAADSAIFLAAAVAKLRARGGEICNLDVTLICERPKIGPHRDAMRARIAAICAIDPDRVNVKATTTEELGFTGRREGIAAQAVATVRL
jgi:2-C-methyl-D-erythritol 4-phosphate cytidylyltransferase/2-C-methyl-D-erythritol 2,4-cyclodiphosphate synthase